MGQELEQYFKKESIAADVQTTTMLAYLNYRNILGVSIGPRPSQGYNNRTEEPTNRPLDKHSNRRRFNTMLRIEEAIVEKLQKGDPCCLDDVVTSLPDSS